MFWPSVCCEGGRGGIGLLPDTEAGVVDLELTEPGEGSGRNDELLSNLASSVEFSFGLDW